MSENSDNLKY